jgi:hypothetical protein
MSDGGPLSHKQGGLIHQFGVLAWHIYNFMVFFSYLGFSSIVFFNIIFFFLISILFVFFFFFTF